MVWMAKVGLTVLSGASIAASGFGIMYLMNREPEPKLIGESELTSSNWEHKNILVADNSENEAWWKWKYRIVFLPFVERNSSSNLAEPFKSVKGDYGEGETFLNKACSSLYSKSGDEGNKEELEKNIREFCTPGGGGIYSWQ